MIDVKLVSRIETFLARIFGKKGKYENEYFRVVIHEWLNRVYITEIDEK